MRSPRFPAAAAALALLVVLTGCSPLSEREHREQVTERLADEIGQWDGVEQVTARPGNPDSDATIHVQLEFELAEAQTEALVIEILDRVVAETTFENYLVTFEIFDETSLPRGSRFTVVMPRDPESVSLGIDFWLAVTAAVPIERLLVTAPVPGLPPLIELVLAPGPDGSIPAEADIEEQILAIWVDLGGEPHREFVVVFQSPPSV